MRASQRPGASTSAGVGSMRSDRQSSYEQWELSLPDALARETELGLSVIASGETAAGAQRFASGAGRHGASARANRSPG